MKFTFDQDYHIHSQLSSCSNDPKQTPERILKYAEDNGLTKICLTNHYWDENVPGVSNWYKKQNFSWISQAKPLPQSDKVQFLFGCETDLDKFMTLGISEKMLDEFDFIIIPTTHLHMTGFTISEEDSESVNKRAELWVKRFESVLNMKLPFHKVGIAHLTCGLIAKPRENYIKTLQLISDDDMERLFKKAAEVGVGIELNYYDMTFSDEEADIVLRPYRIAKQCGCKFYLGSDSHHPETFENTKEVFERAIDMLGLTEEDKFYIKKRSF